MAWAAFYPTVRRGPVGRGRRIRLAFDSAIGRV